MNKSNHKPPKWAEKILEYLLYDDVWKTILGDLQEYYDVLRESEGKAKADLWYWRQVLRYTPSKLIHKLYWTIDMFRQYLKIALRNILKYKGYSTINILGLAIGLASFMLIGMFVIHETSYDRYHPDADRTYRIVRDAPAGFYLGTTLYAVSPTPMTLALDDNFSGIESATVLTIRPSLVNRGENSFFQDGLFTDQNYFNTFSHQWIAGNPTTALQNPSSIILTESIAAKYFGDRNPMGESLSLMNDDEEPIVLTVTGIIRDIRSNSHLQFDFVMPINATPGYENESTNWLNNNTIAYVKADGSVPITELEKQIKALVDPQLLSSSYYRDNPENRPSYMLQPLTDVYLKSSNINFNAGKSSSYTYMYMLSGIAIIILIIASINYMNLSTARSMLRAKEVGVRKVNGAFKSNIMMQFMAEAVIFSFLGILAALIIVIGVFPSFSSMMGQLISIQIFNSPVFWSVFILIGVFVGLASGSYPALFLSGLSPIGVLKKAIKGGRLNRILQSSLVVGQFAITNILILSSLVIFLQMDFIQSRDAGYTRDQILTVKVADPELMNNFDVLKQHFLSNSSVFEVTSGSHLPIEISSQTSGINWAGKPEDYALDTFNGSVNTKYLEMLDIELVSGRYFDEAMDTDTSNHFIINEQLAAGIGWSPEDAVGKEFILWRRSGTIVGVMKDFNFMSYHTGVAPLLLRYAPVNRHNFIMLKVSPQDLQETIAFVEEEIATFSPDYPIEYSFLDDTFNNLYQAELTLGKVFNYFTLLALFIACIGLFGLASFMMEQRTKEVGVRKVLGANVFQIMSLLNRDFIRLVAVSFFVSIPIGWFLANQWLENFAYKISLGPIIFIGMGITSLGIALLTVSYKSFRAARANPVESLRGE